MKTKTIKMTFNEYAEIINKNDMFDLIDDMNGLLKHYKPMTGVEFNADLATIEVIPTQSTIKILMPDISGFVSRCELYGMKNFSNF